MNLSAQPLSEKYATVLADPPWDVQQANPRGALGHYSLMPTAKIAALPARRLVAGAAHLWPWVTNASIFAGKQVMEAWGFSYRSMLTWIKPRFSMGPYLRNQTEHLLFGIHGRAPMQFHGQGTWLYAPVQEHSHKPEEQYAVIERCSPGPYLELFARRPRLGWHVWGNQLASDIELNPEP
jgi:N6-adenosine-specific RNA methylase IME4